MTNSTKQPKWSTVTFKQIEKRREELGLPKSAMANAIGVTNSTYHNWQRGTTVPHALQQEQIAAALPTLTAPAPDASVSGRRASKTGKAGRRVLAGTVEPALSLPERSAVSGENVRGGSPMTDSFNPTHPFFLSIQAPVPGIDLPGIATITAAFIAAQKEAPSAGSVYDFVTGLRKVMVTDVASATPAPEPAAV